MFESFFIKRVRSKCFNNWLKPLYFSWFKYFRIWFLCFKKLCGVHPTMESNSAVCITPRSQWSKFVKKLGGVHPTTESSSAMCFPLQSQSWRCLSHFGVKLCYVHHTAESNCSPQSQNRNLCFSLVAFKGTIRRNPFRGEHIQYCKSWKKRIEEFFKNLVSLKFWLHRVIHTTELNFSNLVIEYLGESKPNSKILWPVYQGPGWVRIMKKIEVENLVTHTF